VNIQTARLGFLEEKYHQMHEEMRDTYANTLKTEKNQRINLENKLIDLKNKALYRD